MTATARYPFSFPQLLIAHCAIALTLAGCGRQDAGDIDVRPFEVFVAELEQEIDGEIGVYALNVDSGASLGHRADQRFATASTFKPLLAAAVLAAVDEGRLALGDPVEVGDVEIQPYSPVVAREPRRDSLTVAELAEAAVTISDNTAANLLFDRVGGPAGLTAFLRSTGDAVTRMDRYETDLNSNERGDPRDTTTPRAMAATVARLLFTDVLSPESRERLAGWLVASRTGLKRLRAGIPDDWRVGDKTGTGANGAVNDVAVAWPPAGGPIVIAVYTSWTDEDVATLNTVHARVAAEVVARIAAEAGR